MNHKRASKPYSQSKPNLSLLVKAIEAGGQQPDSASATSDGVDVDGMVGNDTGITREICAGEVDQNTSTPAASLQAGEGVEASEEVGAADSNVDLWGSISHGEPSGSAYIQATKRSEGCGDGRAKARIKTPKDKLRKLQIALYRKAKAEPKWRFWSLYGEICRETVLFEALRQVRENKGAAGVDGVQVGDIEKGPGGSKAWVEALAQELKTKAYKPSPVRRVWIPKPDGKLRPLGIPTVRDRVVQTALMLVLMPIYEADFHPQSFGYRPKRNAWQAMEVIKEELYKGKVEIIDADLSSYFESIPHRQLMRQLVKRIADGSVLKLIKQWLRAPIVEEGQDGKRRVFGNRRGTPQGGVISPLLANLYLNDLDHGVNEGTARKATMVRYADDLLILCQPGKSEAIQQRLEAWLQRRGLELNKQKTRTLNARKESFAFLGWQISYRKSPRGRNYYHLEPGMKSRAKLMERTRQMLNHQTQWQPIAATIGSLNAVLRGWKEYFRHGHSGKVFGHLHDLVVERVRTWLWRKHGRSRPKFGYYTKGRITHQYGLYPMNHTHS